jgi:hypothetical protein
MKHHERVKLSHHPSSHEQIRTAYFSHGLQKLTSQTSESDKFLVKVIAGIGFLSPHGTAPNLTQTVLLGFREILILLEKLR